MSRIGKAPITIPSGVEVTFKDSVMTVKGKKDVGIGYSHFAPVSTN